MGVRVLRVPDTGGGRQETGEPLGAAMRRSRGRRRHGGMRAAVLLLPSALLVLLFRYYPAFRSVLGSFTVWNGFSPPVFVGLQNYRTYFASDAFLAQVRNLAILFVVGMALHIVAPFVAASAIHALRYYRRTHAGLRYAIVLPMVIPIVVTINVWAFLLNPLSGPVDAMLKAVGIGDVQWFGNSHTALAGILAIGFPWVSGLAFLVFLAGIQNIPVSVIEASTLDGATPFQRTVHIDLPLLIPQIRLVIVLNAIVEIQNFIPILLLTNGGPGNATLVPGLEMYNSAFSQSQYGYGMAIGTLLFCTMLTFTFLVLRLVRSRVTA